MSAFRKLPSIYVFSYFPFGFEGRIWDLIVSVPDHCLSFYFLIGVKLVLSENLSYKQRAMNIVSDVYIHFQSWHR